MTEITRRNIVIALKHQLVINEQLINLLTDQGASKQHLSAARKMNEGYTFAVEFAIRLLEQGKEQ